MASSSRSKITGWIIFIIGISLFIAMIWFFLVSGDSGGNPPSERSELVHTWVYLAVVAFPLLACGIVLILGFEERFRKNPKKDGH